MNLNLKTLSKVFGASLLLANMASHATEVEVNREVQIMATDDVNATVTIENNGEVFELILPKEALHDNELLKQEISGLPQDQQDIIVESLSNVHMLHESHGSGDKIVKIDIESDENTWISDKDQHKVFVVEVKGEGSEQTKHIKKHVIKKSMMEGDHKVFIKSDDENGGIAKAIQHLINRGTFTAEELNEIQQALDAKR